MFRVVAGFSLASAGPVNFPTRGNDSAQHSRKCGERGVNGARTTGTRLAIFVVTHFPRLI